VSHLAFHTSGWRDLLFLRFTGFGDVACRAVRNLEMALTEDGWPGTLKDGKKRVGCLAGLAKRGSVRWAETYVPARVGCPEGQEGYLQVPTVSNGFLVESQPRHGTVLEAFHAASLTQH
jgi:hypothetical protein